MHRLKLLLISLGFFIISISANAQINRELKVSESFSEVSLVSVLKKIKSKYKVRFAFDNQLLQHIKITEKFHNESIEKVVQRLLVNTNLDYEIFKRAIIIKPSNQPITTKQLRKYQPLNVTGIVRDKQTGESLPYSNIFIKGTEVGATSNVDGHFSLLNIPSDTCTLVVNYLGYQRKEIRLKDFQKKSHVEVNLESSAELLEEVVVEDQESQTLNAGQDVSRASINLQKLSSLPNMGEKDILRTLQLLPGISATDETSAGLTIRGSSPDQNLILFDAFSLYHVDHFYGIFSAFNSEAVKSVKVYKGGFEPKYGGRTSSVVDITGKSGNLYKPSIGVGLNMISGNLTLELPIGNNSSLLVAARRSYTDIIQSKFYKNLFDKVIINNIYDVDDEQIGFDDIEPAFHFFDLNTKLTFRPSYRDVVAFSLYHGRDKLNINTEERFKFEVENVRVFDQNLFTSENVAKWGNIGFGTKWSRQWSDQFYSNLNVGYSDFFNKNDYRWEILYNLDRERGSIGEDFLQNNDVSDFTVRLDNEWLINQKTKFSFGTEVILNKVKLYSFSNFEDGSSEESEYSEQGRQLAFYIQNTLTPSRNFSLTFGLRSNFYKLNDYVFNNIPVDETNASQRFFEPRVQLMYNLSKRTKFKASWGLNNQVINRINSNETGAPNIWFLSDGRYLPYLSSEHFIAGFQYEANNFLIDIEGYYKDTDGITRTYGNVIGLESSIYGNGTSISKGIDFLLQKKTGKHTGWISYSLSKVDNSFPELNFGEAFPANEDQRHEIKVVNMFSLGKWDLSSTFVYGSGKPYSDPRGINTVPSDSIYIDYVPILNINQERLPAYHRLDLSAAYNFKLGGGKAQAGLSIYNLYGRENIKYKRFTLLDFDPQTLEPLNAPIYFPASDVKLLGFTPTLFFNIKF
ncbi:carboxypeptidase-like regulatory domain-containing protein [Fulvivirgaceae bacterium BMA10]|uniref:Carboxypeptidase-like regulatory domain-containing protein n=1 Tax=Splendidivirga corallicola TaxID=3051826 RepID=A0ABT8KGS6_9BACT|nr:carboxypeptidase-like regulatory domain-containing protein [Fulvivirgaceae bacterium BMA10]